MPVIFYGSRSVNITPEKPRQYPCPKCKEKTLQPVYHQIYAHFMFLPMFPTRRTIQAVCHNCGKHYKTEKALPLPIRTAMENATGDLKTPAWTRIGIIALGIALVAVLGFKVLPNLLAPAPPPPPDPVSLLRTGSFEDEIVDGEFYQKGSFAFGERQGEWIKEKSTGEQLWLKNYEQGILHGPYIIYDSEGREKESGVYQYGSKIRVKTYFPDGKPAVEYHFQEGTRRIDNAWNDQGKQTVTEGMGTFTEYYPEGAKALVVPVDSGMFTGKAIRYYPDGRKKSVSTFDDWKEKYLEFWVNDPKEYHQALENGSGVVSEYDSFGMLLYECPMKGGFLEGIMQVYNGTEFVFQELEYSNSLPNGFYKDLRDNGKVIREGSMTFGERSGTWKFYWPDGKVHQEIDYAAGKVDGDWKLFNSDGVLVRHRKYNRGKLREEVDLSPPTEE